MRSLRRGRKRVALLARRHNDRVAPLPRTFWEDPEVAAARATEDFAADPAIREYTGPVDLLAPHLAEVEAVILHLAPLSRATIAAALHLRVLGGARGGAVNLNLPELTGRGIPVFFCPGRNVQTAAEYIMGAVLAFARGIVAGQTGIARGLWRLDLYSHALAGPEFAGRTSNLIGARELRLRGPETIFVNAARAELVDDAALRDVLARGAIRGAILDVFSPEPPLANDPILTMENVLITPHIAGATREAAARGAAVVCGNLVAHLIDGTLAGSLNGHELIPATMQEASP